MTRICFKPDTKLDKLLRVSHFKLKQNLSGSTTNIFNYIADIASNQAPKQWYFEAMQDPLEIETVPAEIISNIVEIKDFHIYIVKYMYLCKKCVYIYYHIILYTIYNKK